jgi:hypothetical protein
MSGVTLMLGFAPSPVSLQTAFMFHLVRSADKPQRASRVRELVRLIFLTELSTPTGA